jgi:hypothetical protein
MSRPTLSVSPIGLYLMAAAMILGALLVQLLPRNATIDQAEEVSILPPRSAVGMSDRV